MGLISDLKFRMDRVGTIVPLLDKWRPRNCKTEKDYEHSLTSYLIRELPEDTRITPQYAQGRFRADIVIDEKVVIEIKHNLDTTAKYQRLIGQVASYKEWKGQIILLLIGTTEQDLKKELVSYLKKQGLSGSILSSTFLVGMREDKVIVYEK